VTKDVKELKEILDLLSTYSIETFETDTFKVRFCDKIVQETVEKDFKITPSQPLSKMPADSDLLLYATDEYDAVIKDRE
jgi:hypothetical protein